MRLQSRSSKRINEAYAVLSDETKRRTYDKFGAQWKQYEQSGQSFDWSQWYNAGGAERQQGRKVSPEEFEQMFGGGGAGGSSFSDFFQQLFGGGPAQSRRGPRPTNQPSFGRLNSEPDGSGEDCTGRGVLRDKAHGATGPDPVRGDDSARCQDRVKGTAPATWS